MALSLGSRRVILIAVVLATMFATWRVIESRKSVGISVDSYRKEDAGFVVSTTAFNKLNHKIRLRAVMEMLGIVETQTGPEITTDFKKVIEFSVEARSERKDRFQLPYPVGGGSITVDILLLSAEPE